jgi:hypothetical protein
MRTSYSFVYMYVCMHDPCPGSKSQIALSQFPQQMTMPAGYGVVWCGEESRNHYLATITFQEKVPLS